MIPDWKIWATIAGLALTTYLIRLSFVGLLGGRTLPGWLTRALGFVPVAVLPALIAPMVLSGPEGAISPDVSLAFPAGCALVLGVLTRNVLAGILGGIGGFALLMLVG